MHPVSKLPDAVAQLIEDGAASIPTQELLKAAAELSRSYREASAPPPRITSPVQRLAYLAARMPAIFQVNQLVGLELRRWVPQLAVRSVLDLGCGPGTATLAASQVFDELQGATLVDQDREWLKLSERLLVAANARLAAASHLAARDLRLPIDFGEHDLVIISYALGELAPPIARVLVERAWALARGAIAVIEPGSPGGFSTVLAARDALIAAGGTIVAPCTHAGRCPLTADDWCHFDTRVDRTRQHQRIKAGTLPYEIEKYSYVIAAKGRPAEDRRAARIIKHPLKKSGHVILDLCTAESAAKRIIISRRDKELYRPARAAKWGDLWDPPDRA